MTQSMQDLPASVADAVLQNSGGLPEGVDQVVKGYDFNDGPPSLSTFLQSYATTGFQASALADAIQEVQRMLSYEEGQCKLFLGYTSNLVSSGLREIIRFLAQHKLVDVIVSTAGGIEEDLIKCLKPTYLLGSFSRHSGPSLRKSACNRIGNLLVPNDNYCAFEDWVMPILDRMLAEQKAAENRPWTPSRIIHRLGREINDESSIYYWCAKNDIPVYCPALTDGSLGDMLYFHSYQSEEGAGIIIDILADLRLINSSAVFPEKTGVIILGGGLVKHHILNANLMRNGANHAVFINTGAEYDGSDAGARPDEAVSWGKIAMEATPVKVYGDATLLFPLIVAETFAKKYYYTAAQKGELSSSSKEKKEASDAIHR